MFPTHPLHFSFNHFSVHQHFKILFSVYYSFLSHFAIDRFGFLLKPFLKKCLLVSILPSLLHDSSLLVWSVFAVVILSCLSSLSPHFVLMIFPPVIPFFACMLFPSLISHFYPRHFPVIPFAFMSFSVHHLFRLICCFCHLFVISFVPQ